jgi:chromosome segregation ATPase
MKGIKMKREFLASLKLEDEVINKIIDEYGKSVNSIKDKLSEKTEELKVTKEKVTSLEQEKQETTKLLEQSESFKAESEDFKKQLEDLKVKYSTELSSKDKEISNITKKNLVEKKLIENGATYTTLLMKEIDFDTIEVNDNDLKGFDKQLDTLKGSYKNLFTLEPKQENPPSGGNTGNTGNEGTNDWNNYVENMFKK